MHLFHKTNERRQVLISYFISIAKIITADKISMDSLNKDN